MQNYEDYWKLTLAYTDINGDKFYNTLKAIIDFINQNPQKISHTEYYNDLQNYVAQMNGLDGTSLRKSINQFVKLGFINNLMSYNQESIEFLNSKTSRKRQSIFSKVVYKYSSFNSSITEYSPQKEINFLLKTLEEVGHLSKENIIGLMNVRITEYIKGYVTFDELSYHTNIAIENGFIERKYNQVQYLFNLLNKLDDVLFVNNELYFEEDAKIIFGEDLRQETRKRDGYLHRIYKNQLKEEVDEKCGDIECMLEKLAYPSLVASHIKPFIDSDETEAYDSNNGLLLSRNMDILFDQGYISFEDDGRIIYSSELDNDVKIYLKGYKLAPIYLNDERIKYLEYHREKFAQRLRSA